MPGSNFRSTIMRLVSDGELAEGYPGSLLSHVPRCFLLNSYNPITIAATITSSGVSYSSAIFRGTASWGTTFTVRLGFNQSLGFRFLVFYAGLFFFIIQVENRSYRTRKTHQRCFLQRNC
jgi:hypothetical protein